MRLVLPKTGPGVEAPPFLRGILFLDLITAVGIVAAGIYAVATDAWFVEAWASWALAGYGVALAVADVFAARLTPRGLTWRRRLGYLAIVAVVWNHGPFNRTALAVPTILWMGLVWIALVTGGRALSRAIAAATGEDKPS